MSVTYDLRDFTEEQRIFFKKAEAEGLDVSYIYNPAFSTDQMIEICEGLQAGVDVELFAKPCYTWEQMQELCEALKFGIDITPFSDPEHSAEEMRHVRKVIMQNTSEESLLTNILNHTEVISDEQSDSN